MTCKTCGEKLHWGNSKLIKDVDGEKIGCFCNDCFLVSLEKLKTARFVEKYREFEIYEKNGCYFPYRKCQYHFKSLDDCRARIDHRLAIIIKEGLS